MNPLTQTETATDQAVVRRPRVAVGMPAGGTARDFVAHARWAEREGFDGVWLADAGGNDALATAAAVALETRRLRIGTSVVPVYTRTPAVFASTLYTLHQLAPGRFTLGWGVSSHAMIEGWHGLPFRKPRSTLREATLLLRDMLAGHKSAWDGELLRSHGFRLPDGHAAGLPIYLAALRARMLETAGEVGDGVILNRFPVPVLPRMLEHVAAGAARAGKTLAQVDVVANLKLIVTERPAEALARIRQRFAGYYATPVYNRFLAWCGYEAAAEALAEGWRAGDRAKTLGVLNDDLLGHFVVAGPAQTCHDFARQVLAAGVDTLIIGAYTSDPREQQAPFAAFTPEFFTP